MLQSFGRRLMLPGPSSKTTRCPRCGNVASLDAGNDWRPFCSERCKLIDLGEWFAERHGIAAEPETDEPTDKNELH